MRIIVIFFFFLCSICQCAGQSGENPSFVRDTMSIPETNKVLDGEYVEATLKNLSVVRFYKSTDGKLYLRLIVTKNFYFDKVDVLEVQSGSKSYYAKNTKQYKVSRSSGLFLIEVLRNYMNTIKEEGITGIVFGGTETKFTNKDAAQVKKIAGMFYESLAKVPN